MRPDEYATLFRVEADHWWYRQLRRVLRLHLERYLPDWREASILDAGCGTGGNLAALAGPGRRVGLDRAPEALTRCRTRDVAALVRGDATALPFADACFDAALSMSVIYHQWIDDPGRALQELRRVLRPGGLLLVDVPAYASLTSPHDEAVMTARRFTRRALRDLVESNGFEVLRVTHWNAVLLPAVWAARRLRLVASGRDFEDTGSATFRNRALDAAMRAEAVVLRGIAIPFGVSVHCAARRR